MAIYGQRNGSKFSWKSIVVNILSNPLLIACLAGLVVQTLGWKIPTAVVRTCDVIGASAFPMALVGIGSQLASISVSGRWTESLISTVLKNVFCPTVGWLIGRSLGLAGMELLVILILCAVPTAVSSYVLADQMNGDADLAASSVVIGTACSFFTLSVLLSLAF